MTRRSLLKVGIACCAMTLIACGKQQFGITSDSESFVQGAQVNSKVDVAIMVDNSSSMMRQQTKLRDELPGLIAAMDAKGLDWRIAVTTSDLNGSKGLFLNNGSGVFISKDTPNYLNEIQTRVVPGENGSDLERGISTMQSSLQSASSLLRPDAMLAIIFLSDDNDFSSPTAVQFVAAMDALKPRFKSGLRSWIANYIGTVTLTQDCTQNLGHWNGVGQKYIDVANASGGISASICSSSLAQAVSNVQVRMEDVLTEFPLTIVPNVASIAISINGEAISESTTSGWEYIPSKNVIKFHGGAVPKPNDVVNIHFDPAQAS